jgi:carboxypeptidase PM20D1
VRAVNRLLGAERRPRVLPETQAFFATLSRALPDGAGAGYDDLAHALEDPDFRATFLAHPHYAASVGTTLALTGLHAGGKRNVIPAEATAEIDCRLLAGDDPEEILEWVRHVIDDDQVTVEAMQPPKRPNLSSTDTAVYRALAAALRSRVQDVEVAPAILTGASDSWVFRRYGLQSYGFSPFVLDESELFRIHGIDERVSVENIRAGVRTYTELLLNLYGPNGATEGG